MAGNFDKAKDKLIKKIGKVQTKGGVIRIAIHSYDGGEPKLSVVLHAEKFVKPLMNRANIELLNEIVPYIVKGHKKLAAIVASGSESEEGSSESEEKEEKSSKKSGKTRKQPVATGSGPED